MDTNLAQNDRQKLDGIVQRMVANGESDATIRAVVSDFKVRYARPTQKSSFAQRASNVVSKIFPGKELGEAIGTSVVGLGQLAKGNFKGAMQTAQDPSLAPSKVFGSALESGAFAGSFAVNPAQGFLKSAAQVGGLSGASALGGGLAKGKNLVDATKGAATAAGIGAALGGGFNLLGRAITKIAPSFLSFTSGVPKKAVEQAVQKPTAVKLGRTVENATTIQRQAETATKGLLSDLNDEFGRGVEMIAKNSGQTKTGMIYNPAGFQKSAPAIQKQLSEYARAFSREFRIGSKKVTEDGLTKIVPNFDRSAIVNASERRNVEIALNTLQNWDDYSVEGIEALTQRIAGLRKFDSGVTQKSSVILGKIYNRIAGEKGLIQQFYPELHTLRTDYAMNRKILDEIKNVVSAKKDSPTARTAAINRLSNLFKEDQDLYLNAIKQLAERSGVDYVSLLAGTEFQRVLPTFIRGLGGGAAVSVGASLLNPYLALLLPLFSPRAVGKSIEVIPKAFDITKRITAPIVGELSD